MHALKIVGVGTAQEGREVYIDGSVATRANLTVRGICDFEIFSAKAIGDNLLNVIQYTTRNELDAGAKFDK